MSAVKNLINKFSGHSTTEDSSPANKNAQSSHVENTPDSAETTPPAKTEEYTTHANFAADKQNVKPRTPITAEATPNKSTDGARNGPARDEEASKDGAPAHLVPGSEHYHASSNVQHILDEAAKADEAHRPTEANTEAAGEVSRNREPAPQKPDKANGQIEEDKSGVPAASQSDEPAELTTEPGYKPSKNVQHIIDDAVEADQEHRPEEHTTDQDEEAKKMDNPTAGATNASHPQSDEPRIAKDEKLKIEGRDDNEPAQITTESGYTPSNNVKKILAEAERADEANNSEDHNVDASNHKKLDEPTANMSVHEKSRQEDI